ncbi:MAG: hypothetical protein KIS78_37440 [Labilithrix sp.]|nr:hypothetical protein [Labilithrix sp.]MCW5838136.1 hypothetical protein [Labilithrix sp.]
MPDQEGDPAGQGRDVSGDPSSGSDDDPAQSTTPQSPATISVSSFDVSCEKDDDCVAVFQGAACTACKCPNAAINKEDRGAYASELAKASGSCAIEDVECGECDAPRAGCDTKTNTCALGASAGGG